MGTEPGAGAPEDPVVPQLLGRDKPRAEGLMEMMEDARAGEETLVEPRGAQAATQPPFFRKRPAR